jgi:3-dehydroquinate dehydratase/shikimate dehydrogenase
MILATCRRHQNHGRFNGATGDQLRILEIAVENGACAVDVEIETAELVASKLSMFSGRAQLIVSYHNYENTPQIDQVIKRMTRVPADIYKLVTTARKPSDSARVLAAAKSSSRVKMVVLAMGELGFPTRVLSTSWGGIFTYAAPMHAQGTAAGQVSARQLRHLYRIEKVTKSAKVFGVIAEPVRHSLSPVIHNRAFQARRLDAVYLPFLVSPPQLRDFFVAADKMPIAGFSVTIPHKQKVLRYLDNVDPLARRIGAVNTVWKKAGKWRGTNTDAIGVVNPLSKHLRLAKATVLVAGNGGAARGAASALIEAGATVSLVGRNPDRVRALARMCGGEPLLRDQAEARKFDVLVHATPLGMFPNVNDCFFRNSIPADIVFDMVYNPLDTLLIQHAREQGKTVIQGLEMFIEQAAKQFEIWTGETAPRSVMEKAALEALECKPDASAKPDAKAPNGKGGESK